MDPFIIVALDGMDYDRALGVAEQLSSIPGLWGFKVNDLFFDAGIAIVDDLQEHGSVMVDAKLHDIPNTVKNVCRRLAEDGNVDIVTAHASGGIEMLEEAVKLLPGKVAAVTVLTSFDGDTAKEIYGCSTNIAVARFVQYAHRGGCTYVVCSGQELRLFDSENPLKRIVPGIRPKWYATKDDQKRTMTPREAMDAGASLLVMGRAITRADDPVEAVYRTVAEVEGGDA